MSKYEGGVLVFVLALLLGWLAFLVWAVSELVIWITSK